MVKYILKNNSRSRELLISCVSYWPYESVDVEVAPAKFLLPSTPSAILSIPIIKRLTANINARINNPKEGIAKTINDTIIDNIPTPMRNALDHFDACLSKIPWAILAIPINARPTASKVTKNPIANIGKAITTIANPIVNPPKTILVILDDFVIFGKKPIDILSIPTMNNIIEIRKTRNSIPNPGFTITAMDKAMARVKSRRLSPFSIGTPNGERGLGG